MPTQIVSAQRIINAEPHEVFEVLTDASLHHVIDGSGTVRSPSGKVDRMTLGSRFGMKMKLGIPYTISSEVVEFERDKRIAWAHIGGHRWRYELEAVEGGTRVTESFDWSTAIAPKGIELLHYPRRHIPNMERTLENLDAFLQNRRHSIT